MSDHKCEQDENGYCITCKRRCCWRPKWFMVKDEYGREYYDDLGSMAQTLHSAVVGSSDMLESEFGMDEFNYYLRCVRWVVNNWHESDNKFDKAMKALCMAVLEECDECIKAKRGF